MNDDLTPSGERAVRLAIEVAALRAKIARVEALADDHEERSGVLFARLDDDSAITLATAYGNFARRLRALAPTEGR